MQAVFPRAASAPRPLAAKACDRSAQLTREVRKDDSAEADESRDDLPG